MTKPLIGLRCDVFCNVIDNFGDAGVAWRLVRALAEVTDWQIRLVIDAPHLIDKLGRSIDRHVEVVAWRENLGEWSIADIVIETFACRLPESYLARMRQNSPSPVWINLDYLSAESWVEDCHGLPSPDPQSGIPKYFYFPGFSSKTGGLLCEGQALRRFSGETDLNSDRHWLKTLNIQVANDATLVSLFCYRDSPVSELFTAWNASSSPVHCLLAAGLPEADLQKIIDDATFNGISVTLLPFLTQEDYDRLLAVCDVNFVRGEDSFVRAQWAQKPFIWQAYRQSDEVHFEKLNAFLTRYLADAPDEVARTSKAIHSAWNQETPWTPRLWTNFIAQNAPLTRHNQRWAKAISANGNLAENLARFIKSKL